MFLQLASVHDESADLATIQQAQSLIPAIVKKQLRNIIPTFQGLFFFFICFFLFFSLPFTLRASNVNLWKNKIYRGSLSNDIGSLKTYSSNCDIYTGTWVYEDAQPVYNSSTCPFAEPGFSCQDNGRPDADYLKWRWKPSGCDIPL